MIKDISMRILIAGASGAIGRPLVRSLKQNRHDVFALARSPESAQALAEMGAEPVSADVLEATSVNEAFKRIRPDAVINELTSLPRHYTPAEMRAAAERDRKVRIEGNANLLAAIGDLGVRRYLLQTSGFSYAPGAGLADESTPFIVDASPGVAASARTYAELEAQASRTQNLEFVALRYGFFYGPGTWYTAEGDMGEQVRRRQVPIIGEGQGVWNFVHIDDAAAATAAALECRGRRSLASGCVASCVRPHSKRIGAPENHGAGCTGIARTGCGLLRDASARRIERESPSHLELPSPQTGVALVTWRPQREAAAL